MIRRVRQGRLQERSFTKLVKFTCVGLKILRLSSQGAACLSRLLLFLLLDEGQRGCELSSQYFAEVHQTGQNLKLRRPRYCSSSSSVLRVQLVEIIYQGVLLAQGDGIVQQAPANDLHDPLHLKAGEVDATLAEASEDRRVADLDVSTGSAAPLHPTRIDDIIQLSLAEDLQKRGR